MDTRKHSKPSAAEPAPTTSGGRKPWRKKSPVEVFYRQEEKLRSEIETIEEDLKYKREQLKKFEEARKIFERP